MQRIIQESTLSLPPPPPPPPPASNRVKLLTAAVVIVLVVVISVAVYIVLASPNNHGEGGPGPSLTPSSSPSLAPTGVPTVSPTANPTSVISAGYRLGAWANYTMKNYDSTGRTTALYNIGYSVSEGTNKGVDCWILRTEQGFSGDLSGQAYSMLTVTTYWLDKSTLQGVHYKIEVYSDGQLISLTENDYGPGDVNNIPTAINPTTVVGQETITVPAGTFTCNKAVTSTMDLGNQYVTTIWGNQAVPVIGMVKRQMAENGVLISSTELTAYGG